MKKIEEKNNLVGYFLYQASFQEEQVRNFKKRLKKRNRERENGREEIGKLTMCEGFSFDAKADATCSFVMPISPPFLPNSPLCLPRSLAGWRRPEGRLYI